MNYDIVIVNIHKMYHAKYFVEIVRSGKIDDDQYCFVRFKFHSIKSVFTLVG